MIVAVSTNNKKNRFSRITTKWHRPHRYRRASHVLMFPTWSCMSCYELLQSHLLRHLTYLNRSCTHLVAVCHVSCCWPKFQSIPTDDGKQCQYQYQTIVLNHKTGPSFFEFNWCKKKEDLAFLKKLQIAWHSSVTLVVNFPLYLELIRFL